MYKKDNQKWAMFIHVENQFLNKLLIGLSYNIILHICNNETYFEIVFQLKNEIIVYSLHVCDNID